MSEIVAGRDLDARIAVEVMGWLGTVEWADDDEGRDPYAFEPTADPIAIALNDRDWDCIIPRYSTDIDAALDVVSHLRSRGIAIKVERGTDAPFAICVAALKAVA